MLPSVLDDFKWLISKDAAWLLQQTQHQFEAGTNVVRIAKGLRKKTTSARAAIVMEQTQLRLRAIKKFPNAEKMFFTRRGLEQATDAYLSNYKRERFHGSESVVDICCGIGGDLMALVERNGARLTAGVDSDPIIVLFAKWNCEQLGSCNDQSCKVIHQDFASVDLENWDAIHCDPDRRVNERTVLGSRFSPSLQEIFSRVHKEQKLAIKVAPATPASDDWPSEIEREWIGDLHECKQQVLWHGGFCSEPGKRTATMVKGDLVYQLAGDDSSASKTVNVSRKIQRYIYEPHPTVLAAGLTNELATMYELSRIDPEIAYLTADTKLHHRMMTRFEVVEAFPLSLNKTTDFLKSKSIGLVEVKNRGLSKVIFERYSQLKLSGPNQATLILTRIGLDPWVAITRRTTTDFPDDNLSLKIQP